jgi:hypothetical protein
MDTCLQAGVYGQLNDKVLERLKSFGAMTVLLKENYRNPKKIVDEMCAITGASEPVCKRELLSDTEYRAYASDAEQGKKLRALLVELLREGISARHITVLSGSNRERSVVMRYPPNVGKPIYFLDSDAGLCPDDAITAGTISGFKGLENDFVILTDLPNVWKSDWAKSVYYVGMTRARTKLFALVDGAFLSARAQLVPAAR